MRRSMLLGYGVLAYAAFLVTILYAIGFVGNVVVPKSIDTGRQASWGEALLINALLLGLFALQHTIMARPAFKAWWTKVIPAPSERSTFVLSASLLLLLLFWQWRPMTGVVWQADTAPVRFALTALSLLGWGVVLYSTFLIDHFDLFGVRQVVLAFRGRPYVPRPFVERGLYRWVRHPLMVGFLVAFWSAPTMTQGHLLFCLLTTAYIGLGVTLEERDLLRTLGEEYRGYRARTPLIPGLRRGEGPNGWPSNAASRDRPQYLEHARQRAAPGSQIVAATKRSGPSLSSQK
jgi:protein-S-isoprenylcysteine O-methyltransferase Ste14